MSNVKLALRGLRGESSTDVARRTGAFGVLSTDTDEEALAKMSDATYGPEVVTARGADASLGIRMDRIDDKVRLDGSDNVGIGDEALQSIDGGTLNLGIGPQAGRDMEAGDRNTFVGHGAGALAASGDDMTMVGTQAGNLRTGGSNATLIGSQANGNVAVNSIDCTHVGWQAGLNASGAENTTVGVKALLNGTGIRNVVMGAYAGGGVSDGQRCVFLGYNAAGAGIGHFNSADNAIAIGFGSYCTADSQVSLGNADVKEMLLGTVRTALVMSTQRNYFFGNSGNFDTDNGGCVAVGEAALRNANGALNATAVGDLAMQYHVSGNGCSAFGARALWNSTGCIDTTMVGNRAGASMTTGVGATGIGFRVLEFATESRDATGVGDSALWLYQGNGAVAVGYRAAEYTTGGDEGIYIGRAAGVNRADGERCVFVGAEAGSFPGAAVDPDDGVGAVSAGDRVIGVGYRALANTTGDDHVAVGDEAGLSITGGSGSIFIGSDAGNNGSQKVDAANAIAIGQGAFTTADNQAVLGNASITQTILRGELKVAPEVALPAGGSASVGIEATAAGLGVYFGSGAPTLSAAKGSLYMRSDGSGTNDRMYVNTDGGTTWTAVVTVA